MIGLGFIYVLMGLLVGGVAVLNLRDRTQAKRWGSAVFWGIYAATFLFGGRLPPLAVGTMVIGMALLAGLGALAPGRGVGASAEERQAGARRWGNRLFVPALLIPALTVLGTLTLKTATLNGRPLVDVKQVTLISLGLATLVALAVGMAMLRPPPLAPMHEARRLLDTVGWAAVLPQMLAALGALFALAGVGKVVSALATQYIPLESLLVCVVTYTVGMALFTMLMGNAFAAFPVMTAGIALPLLVHRFGGNPAAVCAVGMLSGFCGTLMTPMAANFNIVPAALLELKDENGVIKAQVPTALILLAVNTALMYFLAFPR
ncbi:MAG: hypothetical protein JWM27_4297 [Gemmatimonadetes bacterium]|nr:hypothetical protein [Gemmatimonadota bacterium]